MWPNFTIKIYLGGFWLHYFLFQFWTFFMWTTMFGLAQSLPDIAQAYIQTTIVKFIMSKSLIHTVPRYCNSNIYLGSSSKEFMRKPLFFSNDKRVPEVELGKFSAFQVDSPDLIVSPDLHGPMGVLQSGGIVLRNTWERRQSFDFPILSYFVCFSRFPILAIKLEHL